MKELNGMIGADRKNIESLKEIILYQSAQISELHSVIHNLVKNINDNREAEDASDLSVTITKSDNPYLQPLIHQYQQNRYNSQLQQPQISPPTQAQFRPQYRQQPPQQFQSRSPPQRPQQSSDSLMSFDSTQPPQQQYQPQPQPPQQQYQPQPPQQQYQSQPQPQPPQQQYQPQQYQPQQYQPQQYQQQYQPQHDEELDEEAAINAVRQARQKSESGNLLDSLF